MIYLVDPSQLRNPKCHPVLPFCPDYCGIKPLYGVDPDDH